jgi:hypothetical protein
LSESERWHVKRWDTEKGTSELCVTCGARRKEGARKKEGGKNNREKRVDRTIKDERIPH